MFIAPYSSDTVRIPNEIIPGNETSDSPVEFDIIPAWGADLARLKSFVTATDAMISDDWTPEMQASTVRSLEKDGGLRVFANTVTEIRNLWIPAEMARRAGLADPKGNSSGNVAVANGQQFSQVSGSSGLLSMGLYVAYQIIELNRRQDIDPRFFAQPSGSGGPDRAGRMISSARRARSTRAGRATVGGQKATGDRPSGT